MKLTVIPKSKELENLVKAFLNSLGILLHSDQKEDAAFYKAMQKGRKSKPLNADEKAAFLLRLKHVK